MSTGINAGTPREPVMAAANRLPVTKGAMMDDKKGARIICGMLGLSLFMGTALFIIL
ncbi:MAG: hypothetical protein P1P77_18160 [Spirochaetaceae bacterium]|nr:hypothetical protein [Spirochaetaceae bacterium]